MAKTKFIIGLVVASIVLYFGIWRSSGDQTTKPAALTSSEATSEDKSILDLSRVTKKPFGIYITPKNSPIQPEKFTGYHTGADFETTPDETDIDIPVPAICNGKLLLKKQVSGYGGVAVQSCALAGQEVTIIYGHLKLSSINTIAGQMINEGNFIGNLGKGFSSETDGERKHLHLGIHKGTGISILGYVQKQSDLTRWLDPAQFLK